MGHGVLARDELDGVVNLKCVAEFSGENAGPTITFVAGFVLSQVFKDSTWVRSFVGERGVAPSETP